MFYGLFCCLLFSKIMQNSLYMNMKTRMNNTKLNELFHFTADGPKDMHKKIKDDLKNVDNIDEIVKRKALEVSLSRSETGFTTWSKLKKNSSTQLHR